MLDSRARGIHTTSNAGFEKTVWRLEIGDDMGPCPREFALVTTELRAAPTEPDIRGLGTSFLNTQLSNGPVVAHSAFLSRWGPDPPTSQELQGQLTAICFYEQKLSSFPQGRSPSWWPTVRRPRQGLCPHLGHPAQPPQPEALSEGPVEMVPQPAF